MQVIVVPTAGGAGRLRILDPPDAIGAVDAIGTVDTIGAVDAISSVDATSTVEGTPNNVADTIGVVEDVPDLAARIRELEHRYRPRWVWPDTTEIYPALLRAGVTLHRCHDLALVESITLGYRGEHDRPRGLAAAFARARGLPEPANSLPYKDSPHKSGDDAQPTLFEPQRPSLPGGADELDAISTVLSAQRRFIAGTEHPDRLAMLAAAESAGALAAAEMSHHGLPWSRQAHLDLLAERLGPRPSPGVLPAKLATLAERISEAFGGRQVNPDSSASLLRAFASDGIALQSTRAHVLREIDHPAVPHVLAYKELARLWTANGWSWLNAWVHNGRFRPEYVVGGVVSGRWATNGGGALQLPKVLRIAVRAEPGWALVVADAAQLEPRVLAALSGDRRLADAAGAGDLYAGVAADAFGGDRPRAKIALLSAMYGGTTGGGLSLLRKRFPVAVDYVEAAARVGEAGGVVRSRLGRTSPPPPARWRALMDSTDDAMRQRSRRAARDWGRFTRNFVVQASAAEWALAVLANLRRLLAEHAPAAQLVFFLHDEVIVHCPHATVHEVRRAIAAAAEQASRQVFGDSVGVLFPLHAKAVQCYADAK